jgi:hypothetical protein
MSPNYETSCFLFPFFDDFNDLVLNTNQIKNKIRTEDLDKKLFPSLKHKNDVNSETNNSSTLSSVADNPNGKPNNLNEDSLKTSTKRLKLQNICNEKSTKNDECIETQINDKNIIKVLAENTIQKQNSFQNLQSFPIQTISPIDIQNNFDSILIDVMICHCFSFNYINPSIVWETVSKEMERYGFVGMNAILCRVRFMALAIRYNQVLWSTNDLNTKCSLFPLFQKFNSLTVKNPFFYCNSNL